MPEEADDTDILIQGKHVGVPFTEREQFFSKLFTNLYGSEKPHMSI